MGQNKENPGDEKEKKETQDLENKQINEYGQVMLDSNQQDYKIHLISIIGEVEGHECSAPSHKTTKYDHILPQLAAIEDSKDVDGVLILINTVGGDVEAGLAIAEMIASIIKPTVSLVLGGSHSIGVPLATSTDYSFIVPTGTMIIHPVRVTGMVIGVTQSFEYMERIQDRIINFVCAHSNIDYPHFKALMLETTQLTKDIGSILVGKEAVEKGIINEVGGIQQALGKLHSMIDEKKKSKECSDSK